MDFQRIVQFKTDSKEENLKLIEEYLIDFVRNSVCLKTADRLRGGSFEVVYLDLTDDEK